LRKDSIKMADFRDLNDARKWSQAMANRESIDYRINGSGAWASMSLNGSCRSPEPATCCRCALRAKSQSWQGQPEMGNAAITHRASTQAHREPELI